MAYDSQKAIAHGNHDDETLTLIVDWPLVSVTLHPNEGCYVTSNCGSTNFST